MKKNSKEKGRVLLVYPNSEGYGGIPNGLALLSSCLKEAGFETKCFDTTFLNSPPLTHFYRAKHGGFIYANYTKAWGGWTPDLPKKIPQLFIQAIKDFKPDIIAVTIVDVSYNFIIPLLKKIRKKINIPVIAGGITVTMCPEMVLNNEGIDVICVGEGEDALVELACCITERKDYSHIKNLWIKKNGQIIKNPLRPLKDMDTLAFQDWSVFDGRHYYKPYLGKFRKTGFFELARGCHFNCSYCCTANQRKLYKGLGNFVRIRNIDITLDEICHIRNKYDLELVFFIDDNFLGMPQERFDYFCEQYKKRVNLPFYIQTRSETVKEENIRKLKKVNISTVAVGVEHGDEEFRRKCLNRRMSNENLKKTFNILHKYKIRSTANIIIGLPDEKESIFPKTVKLLRQLKPSSVSINYFQPYQGTQMRERAVELGYIPKNHIINESNTCLDMPQFRRERIIHYYENFKKYLDGEWEIEE